MIILTGQPKSTQSVYKYTCKGVYPRMYMTKLGKEIKEGYTWEAKAQWKKKPTEKHLGLVINFFHNNRRKNDIDNFLKLCLDSLEGVVFKNDSQIRELHLYKHFDKSKPRIEIEVML